MSSKTPRDKTITAEFQEQFMVSPHTARRLRDYLEGRCAFDDYYRQYASSESVDWAEDSAKFCMYTAIYGAPLRCRCISRIDGERGHKKAANGWDDAVRLAYDMPTRLLGAWVAEKDAFERRGFVGTPDGWEFVVDGKFPSQNTNVYGAAGQSSFCTESAFAAQFITSATLVYLWMRLGIQKCKEAKDDNLMLEKTPINEKLCKLKGYVNVEQIRSIAAESALLILCKHKEIELNGYLQWRVLDADKPLFNEVKSGRT